MSLTNEHRLAPQAFDTTNALAAAMEYGITIKYRRLNGVSVTWDVEKRRVEVDSTLSPWLQNEFAMHGVMHLSHYGTELLDDVRRGNMASDEMETEIGIETAAQLIPYIELRQALTVEENAEAIARRFGVQIGTLRTRLDDLLRRPAGSIDPLLVDILRWPTPTSAGLCCQQAGDAAHLAELASHPKRQPTAFGMFSYILWLLFRLVF